MKKIYLKQDTIDHLNDMRGKMSDGKPETDSSVIFRLMNEGRL